MTTKVATTNSNVQKPGFEFVATKSRLHAQGSAALLQRHKAHTGRPNYFAYDVISTPRSTNKFVREYRQPPLRSAAKPVAQSTLQATPQHDATAKNVTHAQQVAPAHHASPIKQGFSTIKPVTAHKKRLPKLNRVRVANLTIGLALCMCAWLGLNIYHFHHATAAIEQQPNGAAVLGESDSEEAQGDVTPATVSEKKPTGSYRYNADAPKKLTIKKLGVNAPIITVSDNKKGEMATPTNIWTAGWYKKSASPKDNGTTVINGHVSGPTKPGIFSGLKKLAAGDQIQVTMGDNTTYTYKVVKTQVYKAGDMGAELYNSVSDKPGLNLVTCTGELNKDRSSYHERMVVFSERV